MRIFRSDTCRALTAFFLLAFLTRMLIPAGFMPGTDEDGRMQMVICTPSGQTVIDVDDSLAQILGGSHGEKEDGNAQHPPCPFAPVLAQNINTPVSAVDAYFYESRADYDLAAHAPIIDIAVKPWHSQGPPASLT